MRLSSWESRNPRCLQTGKPRRPVTGLKLKMVDSLPGLVRKPERGLIPYWNPQSPGPGAVVSNIRDIRISLIKKSK